MRIEQEDPTKQILIERLNTVKEKLGLYSASLEQSMAEMTDSEDEHLNELPRIFKVVRQNYIQPTTIIAYQEPITQEIPAEKLFSIAESVGRRLEAVNETRREQYLDNVSQTPEFQKFLHAYPAQAVLLAASRKGFIIGKYSGDDPRYQGAYQANGIAVIAQLEVRQEIESRPHQLVPLEFLVN